MKDPVRAQDLFINTMVGAGASFRGDLNVEGLLRIDGDFWGQIKSESRVFIGAGGRVKSQIQAREVVVGGTLKGDIVASEKVVVLSTGMVIGNIYAPRMVLEEGMVLEGYCSVTPQITGTDSEQPPAGVMPKKQPYSEGSYNPFRKDSATLPSWNA